MSDIEPVGALIRGARRRRQARRWEAQTFPTSGGGTLRVPYPSGVQAPPETGGAELFGSAPIGEIIRVSINHEHHGPGEPLIFGAVLDQLGFPDTELPGVEIELPHTAVYGIEGDFSYMGHHDEPPFVGGGSVSLLLNGAGIPGLSPIRAGGTVERNLGKTFTLAQEFVAQKGDVLSIVLNHVDAEPDVQGVIEVATKEQLRVVVEPDFVGPFGDFYSFNTTASVTSFQDAGFLPFTGFAGLQAGDLEVLHVHGQTISDDPPSGGPEFQQFNPVDGWQVTTPFIIPGPLGGQIITFLLWKVLTTADAAASDVFAGNSTFTKPLNTDVGGRWELLGMAFRGGPTSVTVRDVQASPTWTPWSTTLISGGGAGQLMATTVVTNQNFDPPVPAPPGDDEVAVSDWASLGFIDSPYGVSPVTRAIKMRAQRGSGELSNPSIDIATGDSSDRSSASSAIWAVL